MSEDGTSVKSMLTAGEISIIEERLEANRHQLNQLKIKQRYINNDIVSVEGEISLYERLLRE